MTRDLGQVRQRYQGFQALPFVRGVRGTQFLLPGIEGSVSLTCQLALSHQQGARESSWTKLASCLELCLILDQATGLWCSHTAVRNKLCFLLYLSAPHWRGCYQGSATLTSQLGPSLEVSHLPDSCREAGLSWFRTRQCQFPKYSSAGDAGMRRRKYVQQWGHLIGGWKRSLQY